MALSDLELSLMAFPQNWNAATQQLSVNLLMLPVGSPLAPLGTGPQFAGTTAYLKANFIAGGGSATEYREYYRSDATVCCNAACGGGELVTIPAGATRSRNYDFNRTTERACDYSTHSQVTS